MKDRKSLIEEVDILDEAKECFLVYSEEVLTDRAIPAAEDGLLSSQRKILWTMSEVLKMDSNSKPKKCQALVGSTLSTAYVHGDQACYGVLCKMSQEYLMRYPLIQGQGSLGTQENNDLVSSSRYTEAKPSIYTDLMMDSFKKNIVPLKETYNGEYMEPIILPSLFPNSICNGRQAVGISMSHNSSPNNLTEVCNAIIAFIKNNGLTLDNLLEYIPGPDFPLGGTVLNTQDVREAFRTGKSKISLKVQGDYEIDGRKIVFTSIPYRTYRNKIREQLESNIEVFDEILEDFNDESSVGQNKLIFTVKSGVDVQKVLDGLFNLTDLQTTISYNMNFIVNGTPKLCSMLDLIKSYVIHQENILIKATELDKEKAEARAHILEGLITAVNKLDEVISLIKSSESRTDARSRLMDFLSIDEIQANAILSMKLGSLTRINKIELVKELEEKKKFILECIRILTDKEYRDGKIIERIKWLRDTYGDKRRTKLLYLEVKKQEKPIIEEKECEITISKKGIITRIDSKNSKPSKQNSTTVAFSQKTTTNDYLMVFSSKGKMYRILINNIPEKKNAPLGTSLNTTINFEEDEHPIGFTTLFRDTNKQFILFATKNGVVKKVPLSEYDSLKRNGVLAIKLKDEDRVIGSSIIEQEEIVLITKKGKYIRFNTVDMPTSSRIAQGVKGIKLDEDDCVIMLLPVYNNNAHISIVSNNNSSLEIPLKDIDLQKRGSKGTVCCNSVIKSILIMGNIEKK